MHVPTYVWTSLGIVGLVGLIAGLSKAAGTETGAHPNKIAQHLLESADMSLRSARQDTKASQKFVDACNGIASVLSAKLIASAEVLAAVSHVNVDDLLAMLRTEQADARQALETQSFLQ